jgi:hypothetical protein
MPERRKKSAIPAAICGAVAAAIILAAITAQAGAPPAPAPVPAPAPSQAQDTNGALLVRLFNNVCIPNMGKPDQVRTQASAMQLPAINDRLLLDSFVGPGAKKDAWQVPSPNGQRFALSIRAATQACAVWAEQADPRDVEPAFAKEMEDTAQKGLTLRKDDEQTQDTPFGTGRSVSYYMSDPKTGVGFEFHLITAERPGGVFQATLQVARVGAH